MATDLVSAFSYRQKILLIGSGGLIIGMLLYFAYLLRMPDYLGNASEACVNCHVMTPFYATWMHSSHARDATCNDCHVPHNNVLNKYYFKAKDGMGHVY
ncbi:MAG: NapC/NirT family cytochrome c, partial [Dethiobacteria bacterium]